MVSIPDRPVSPAEITELQKPLANDLMAFYRLVSDAAEELLDTAIEEGWTPERFIDELDRMIAGDNRAPETVAVPGAVDITITKARPRVEVLKDLQSNLGRLVAARQVRKADDFAEDDHPRAKDGKFTSGSAGNSGKKDYTQDKEQSHGKRDQEDGRSSDGPGRRDPQGALADIRSQGRGRFTSRNVDYSSGGGNDLKKVQDFNARAGLPADAKSVKTISEHKDGSVTLELDSAVCSQHYHDTLKALREKVEMGAQVSLKDPEDYKSMRLFSADDGSAVIALDGTDLVSVCGDGEKRPDGSSPVKSLIWQAVAEGVETADCYGTFLPKFYSQFGFQPVARLEWNQEIWVDYAEGAKIALDHLRKEAPDYYSKLRQAGL